jgi:hypothetical protein
MSIKEPPVANRCVDQFDKELAYRKHIAALANAKAVVQTTNLSARCPCTGSRAVAPIRKKHQSLVPAKPPPEFWEHFTQGSPTSLLSFTEIPLFNGVRPMARVVRTSSTKAVSRHESDDNDIPDPSESSDSLLETQAVTRWRESDLPNAEESEVIPIIRDLPFFESVSTPNSVAPWSGPTFHGRPPKPPSLALRDPAIVDDFSDPSDELSDEENFA